MPDLDRLLHSDLSHAAAQAAQPPDFSAIEQRGAQRHRTRTVMTAAAAVLIVLAALGTSFLGGVDRTAPQPVKDPSPPAHGGCVGEALDSASPGHLKTSHRAGPDR